MKEKVFLSLPDPFTPAEHTAFARRVMGMLPERKPFLRPWFALAAASILVFGAVFLVVANHDAPESAFEPAVHVANPMNLAAAQVRPAAMAGFPAPPAGLSPKVDVFFHIDKSDHQIRIAWQEMEGYQYIVQKCVLSANGKKCETKTIVNGSAYQEKAQEESRLVLYTVEAVKS